MDNVVSMTSYRSPMRTTLFAAIATVSLLASCSSDESAADTTAASVETTQAADTTAAPATTEAATKTTISRDAELAVTRCLEEADERMVISFQLGVGGDGDLAYDLCTEARTQVEVDDPGSKTIGDLALALGDLNLVIAEGNMLQALGAEISDEDYDRIMSEVQRLQVEIGRLLLLVA
jgi:hypothetical protein